MSNIPLSNIQEIIERSLFEDIRKEIVDKGYLPDISDVGTYPDSQVGWDQWQSDIDDIVTNQGFAIEIFGVGNNKAKGTKKVPRIVLEPGNFLPGALGGDPRNTFEAADGNTFNILKTPLQTTDFYMNICIVAETIQQLRTLTGILAISVPRRGYHNFYNDPTKTFFARFLNYYDRDDESEGFLEHVYSYEIPDAWDQENQEIGTIAAINEITFNTNIQKYMDGSWGSDSDPLVVN